MRTVRRFVLPVLALAACSTPPPAPPPAEPLPEPPPQAVATTPAKVARTISKLDNGVTVVITPAAPGHDANLQFGFLAGTAFIAPGSCELAAQVLLYGADSTQGRPSLAAAIARLGGTVQVRPGPLTTWFDVRVPGNRWQEALAALARTLATPTRSRSQIERIRTDFVADRTAWVRRDPLAAMATVLQLGEVSTANYLTGLLDRDPAEISLFESRMWRPDKAVLALEVPADLAAVQKALAADGAGGLGRWLPPPAVPGPAALLDRKFESGIYQFPARDAAAKAQPCRVALVCALPDLSHELAAEQLLLHACFTLGGAGGRLERLQQIGDLANVTWRSDVVPTSDSAALMLTTTVPQADVGRLWRTVQAARASLREVPPNDSELAIAARRLPLTSRLTMADDGERLRTTTTLALRGVDLAALDRRGANTARMANRDLSVSTDFWLGAPFAMLVFGGEPLTDVADVRLGEALPGGHAGEPTTADSTATAANASVPTTWHERAADAIGDRAQLRLLVGWQYEAKLNHEQAPPLDEATRWQDDGALQRTRTVLGQTVETTLDGTKWSERTGTTTVSLDSRQAAFARREQQRHPLALLAAALRGELRFRQVAQRDAGDRTMMVLEVAGERFDRLRIHIDTQSHLVRVVESWETLPDGTVLRVHDAWSDYRTVDGLRVPFRRLSTHDDGQNRVETVFTSWRPKLRLP